MLVVLFAAGFQLPGPRWNALHPPRPISGPMCSAGAQTEGAESPVCSVGDDGTQAAETDPRWYLAETEPREATFVDCDRFGGIFAGIFGGRYAGMREARWYLPPCHKITFWWRIAPEDTETLWQATQAAAEPTRRRSTPWRKAKLTKWFWYRPNSEIYYWWRTHFEGFEFEIEVSMSAPADELASRAVAARRAEFEAALADDDRAGRVEGLHAHSADALYFRLREEAIQQHDEGELQAAKETFGRAERARAARDRLRVVRSKETLDYFPKELADAIRLNAAAFDQLLADAHKLRKQGKWQAAEEVMARVDGIREHFNSLQIEYHKENGWTDSEARLGFECEKKDREADLPFGTTQREAGLEKAFLAAPHSAEAAAEEAKVIDAYLEEQAVVMAEFAMAAALIAAQADTMAKIEANEASKPKWLAELATAV